MEEQKPQQTVEKSLQYMAWSLKELVIEIKDINNKMNDLINEIGLTKI